MSPQELYDLAEDVLKCCDSTGVSEEKAETFIAALQASILRINEWLHPTFGTIGYADGQLIDLLRQLKFRSETTTKNFPNGVHDLSAALTAFREYLQNHYAVHSEEIRDVSNG